MKIGNLLIPDGASLAPIAGYSDVGFRNVCARLGATITYTEMVSAKGLCYNGEKTIELLHRTSAEKICAAQIFGAEPEFMEKAAMHKALAPFDFIDINMGCPVAKIVKCGEGSALLNNIPLAQRVVEATRKSGKPVTVKMRIGFEENSNIAVEFAKAMQEAGAAALAVHGRTRAQFYSGNANWNIIAEVKKALSIPVIANGDVHNVQDYESILKTTNADSVMIARGAFGNPFVYRDIAQHISYCNESNRLECHNDANSNNGTNSDNDTNSYNSDNGTSPTNDNIASRVPLDGMSRIDAILIHLNVLREFHSEKFVLTNFRKHMVHYAKGIPNGKQVMLKSFEAASYNDLVQIVKELQI